MERGRRSSSVGVTSYTSYYSPVPAFASYSPYYGRVASPYTSTSYSPGRRDGRSWRERTASSPIAAIRSPSLERAGREGGGRYTLRLRESRDYVPSPQASNWDHTPSYQSPPSPYRPPPRHTPPSRPLPPSPRPPSLTRARSLHDISRDSSQAREPRPQGGEAGNTLERARARARSAKAREEVGGSLRAREEVGGSLRARGEVGGSLGDLWSGGQDSELLRRGWREQRRREERRGWSEQREEERGSSERREQRRVEGRRGEQRREGGWSSERREEGSDGGYCSRRESVSNGPSPTHETESSPLKSNLKSNGGGQVDYKKLWEDSQTENSRLRQEMSTTREDLDSTRQQLDSAIQVLAKNSVSDIEKREKKVLEKKLGEMEDELKTLDQLKADNQRLRDENGALIRVISKLSK